MASRAHQKIIGLIAKKMRLKNYEIVSLDGHEKLICSIDLKNTPCLNRHRPDLIGINMTTHAVCIGEAKTASDIFSERTKEEICDFSDIVTKKGEKAELIIGIPESAKEDLSELLERLGLKNKPNISYIWIPDELLLDINNEEKL